MLPRLRAEEQIASLNSSAYPHMERNDARSYARAIEADAGQKPEVRKMTRADLQSIGITTD